MWLNRFESPTLLLSITLRLEVMKGRMYSRGQKKLEKNGKDRKETNIVKNEDLTPLFVPILQEPFF